MTDNASPVVETAKNGLSLRSLSDADLKTLIQENAKYKVRSQDTTLNTHFPELEAAAAAPDQFQTFLIGSSMLERFKTTGHDLDLGIHPHIFNCGVGGDTIPNVLYRLTLGVLEKAKTQVGIHTVIVNIGSNDFKKKGRCLSELQVYQFGLLIEALKRTWPQAKVVITALFRRKDLKAEATDDTNVAFEKLAKDLDAEWLEAPEVSVETGYEDHVHLNREGYEIWDKWLVKRLRL